MKVTNRETMDYLTEEGHLTEEGIALYAETLQSENWTDLAKAVSLHIEDCQLCHGEALALYAVLSEMEKASEKAAVDKSQTRKLERMKFIRWAMVAVLAGLSFYFYRYLDRPHAQDQIQQDQPIADEDKEKEELIPIVKDESEPTTPKKENTESTSIPTTPVPKADSRVLYASNFVPSAEMEALLADARRGADLELISPVQQAVFQLGENILFEWTGTIDEALFLQIENNKGEEVHQTALSALRFDYKPDLPPGLYYWRLESEEDLLMLGRLELE